MPQTAEIAQRLVDYDERFAREVLELICTQLGGPAQDDEDPSVDEMRTFLAKTDVAHTRPLSRLGDVSDAPSTTSEWKTEFSYYERLRTLGLALSERLR